MHIRIDRSGPDPGPRGAGTPVYLQIAEQIRAHVDSGEIVPGHRLPPIRTLARDLGVNRDTVALAYEHLARAGLVHATVGRGTFVSAGATAGGDGARAAPPLAPVIERLLDFERARPSFADADGVAPLHALVPDPALYPLAEFRHALDRALDEGGPEVLVYGGHRGHARLQEVMAERLRAHGLPASERDVVLCQGASQGISLALRLFAEPGDLVAVEEPTYHNVLTALVALGLRPVPIPMRADGPDLGALERALARPEVKLLYTMPSFHNPLGTSTGLAHRRALLAIAGRHAKPVVEDGFQMDLRYDGEPVAPLAALDEHGLVVHLFSFSKSLFPGVRVGAITARGRAVEGLVALRQASDLSGSLVLQAALAEFVASGAYERHLHRFRRALRERRDALLAALAREMPDGTRWTRPVGGCQVWVDLPPGLDSRALLDEARRAGVLYAPGYQFHYDGRPSGGLRLTTALAGVDEIRRGVAALGRVVRRHARDARRAPRESAIHV